MGRTFFFYCTNENDRDNLLAKRFACFQGGLICFKCWFPSSTIRSFNFASCPLWVRVEGIPLTSNKVHVARRALEKLGRIIRFDEASLREGPKEFIRAKVYVEMHKPLIPGYFYEYSSNHFKWIDFIYEGVFVFCKKCGIIGHKEPRCRMSLEEAHLQSGARMAEVYISRQNLLVGHPPSPCYSNKIIGLRRIEVLRTSRIDLIVDPSDEIPFAANFVSSASETESSSSNDSPGPGNGSCSRKMERQASPSDDDDERGRKRPLWERRNFNLPQNLQIERTNRGQGCANKSRKPVGKGKNHRHHPDNIEKTGQNES